MSFSGGCLCGAVRYEGAEPGPGGHCQCHDCRRSSGSGHCSHMVVPEAGFSVVGALSFYDATADSGNVISRGFCPTCGAPVYSRNSGMPGLLFLRASSLDDPEVFQPQMVVFRKEAPSWDLVDPALPAFDAMPPPEAMPDLGD